MRAPLLVATACGAAVWLSACSGSGPGTPQHPDQSDPAAGRDIRLVEPAVTQPSSVSDLEAGRASRYARIRLPDQRIEAAAPAPGSEPAVEPQLAPATETVAPELTPAPTAQPAAADEEPAIVRAPALPAWRPGDGEGMDGGMAGHQPWGSAHGGPIIIRGGPGGPDDDCDLGHRRRGFPAAVNQAAPTLGGFRAPRGRAGSIRVGIR